MRQYLVFIKIILIGFVLFLASSTGECQVLKGKVSNNQGLEPIEGVIIKDKLSHREFSSDSKGEFLIPLLNADQLLDLEIIKENYISFSIKILPSDWNQSIQEFFLNPGNSRLSNDLEASTSSSDQETEESDVYSLLSSSDDPLLDASSFDWSAFRYRLRSVQSNYDQFGMNGFLLSNLSTSYPYYNFLSGQNLLIRYGEAYRSFKENSNDFGTSGLSQWVDAYPENFRNGLVVRYAESNRAYRHKLDAHYVSGALKYNWYLVAGLNRRWSEEASIPGSFYDAWGSYLGISKSLGQKHTLSLLSVYAPSKRGKASPATKEVYALAGDNYYNSYWGYQEGERRNSRVASTKVPMALLNYFFNINENFHLEAGLLGLKGQRTDSQLDWYNAPDPRPDYYQKLPSYIEDSLVDLQVIHAWEQDVNVRQLNWTRFYQANYSNETTVENANGVFGNTVSGNRAVYWLSKRHVDPSELQYFGKLNWNSNRHRVAFNYRARVGSLNNYLELDDLLGADFLLDLEDFIDNVNSQHPDIRYTNHIIQQGDAYSYHYKSHHFNHSIWGKYNYYGKKLDFNLGISTDIYSFSREGFMLNAINTNSLGRSETINQLGFGINSLLTWKLNGRNYLQGNLAYQKLPNRFDQTFVNPEWNANQLTIKDQTEVYMADLSYFYRTPTLKIQFSAYTINYKNQIINKNFFLDEQLEGAGNVELADGGLINAFFTKLNQEHRGIESSVEYKLPYGFEITGNYTLGKAIYTSRPSLLLFDKFSSSQSSHLIYFKNFYVPGSPMQAASVVLKYNFKRNGFVTLSLNALTDQYLEPNPLRRIPQAIADINPESNLYKQIINQEKLPDVFYLNLFLYKGFKLFKQDFSITCSVNNLLNQKDIISGGFEQYRFDYAEKNPDKFPSKYYYLQGINYFCGLSWRLN